MPASVITHTKLNSVSSKLIYLTTCFPQDPINIRFIQQGLMDVVLQQDWILRKNKENTPKLSSFQHKLSKMLLFTLKTLFYSCMLCPKRIAE